jgi:hypothetical protein
MPPSASTVDVRAADRPPFVRQRARLLRTLDRLRFAGQHAGQNPGSTPISRVTQPSATKSPPTSRIPPTTSATSTGTRWRASTNAS